MSTLNEQMLAEAAVTSFGKAIGVELPAEQLVELGAALAAKFRGQTWDEAILAGKAAAERIKTEADAERARRARLGEP